MEVYMPSTITHSYFIMDIYDRLPINRKQFLLGQKENLKVFSQSLDVLNFYTSFDFKKNKKVRNFSKIFHTKKTGDYIITLINYIKYNNYSNDPEVMSFLYGIISHYVLDSTIHPYIYYKVGIFNRHDKTTYKYNCKHHVLENLIDQYMVKLRENILPNKFKYYKQLKINQYNDNLNEIINFSFREVYKISKIDDVLLKSTKNMKLAFKYLRYDPIGIKIRLYSVIDLILPKSIPKISFLSYDIKNKYFDDYLNISHKKWHYPTKKSKKYNYSFIDLYLISLSNAINMIREVDLYIYKDKKVNLENIIQNKSYLTGMDLKSNQELKYFEF